jgi:hypothetical protein
MDLFMSAEIHKDIGPGFGAANRDVKNAVNSLLPGDYGPGVEKWYHIAIIMPATSAASYPEIREYRRDKKQAEFRLTVDFETFRTADAADKRRLLCESLLRSLTIMAEMDIPDFHTKLLYRDRAAVAAEHGWA